MIRANRHRHVTASDLAQMGFCEMSCYLKATQGVVDTEASAEAKRAGQDEHHRFHAQVTAHHNRARAGRPGEVTDRRCFIATAVYGDCDPRTDQLRRFRDTTLLPSVAGRVVVRLYYRFSPCLADGLRHHPWMQPVVRRILDIMRRRIASSTSKDASHERDHPEHRA